MAKAKVGFGEVDRLKVIENVFGSIGNHKLTGDGRANELGGYSGENVLKGKGGNDTLSGGWASTPCSAARATTFFCSTAYRPREAAAAPRCTTT